MIDPHFGRPSRIQLLSAEIPSGCPVPPGSCVFLFPKPGAVCRRLLSARLVIGHRTVALRRRQCASALG